MAPSLTPSRERASVIITQLVYRRPPRPLCSDRRVHRVFDALQLSLAPALVLLVALLELRDHSGARTMDGVHHVLMLARAALGDEDHQVQMRRLVPAQRVA